MDTQGTERVLVLAPTRADAELSHDVLADAKVACHICRDLRQLSVELDVGAAAVLVTEEVFVASDAHELLDALRRQPPWSDIPVVFLATAGAASAAAAWAIELLGNVTVLERPVRLTTLVTTLHSAIRARRRQYELRQQVIDLKLADAELRKQSHRQRLLGEAAAILLSTEEPDAMLHALFDTIAPHFGLDGFFNFVVQDGSDALRLDSYAGVDEATVRPLVRLKFGEGVAGLAASERRAIAVGNMQTSDDPTVKTLRRFGFNACSCHPLIAEGRLLGTLTFVSRSREYFDADELEFMQTICHYVTGAYERVRLIRQLRDADRRKDEFLATLAHELRNPLAPIRNALHITRLAPRDDAALAQARAMMERQLEQMVRLIDDLLDVSRITRGKLELRKERVDLASIINSAVDTTRPLIEAAGHALTITLPPQPVYIDADPLRLAQVFSNLLNNAVKYTERGGHIWFTAVRDGRDVVVSVRDTGVGIPSSALASIFEMFAQVDRSLEKAQGGLGIGLTLVKRLIELHGGTVEARSDGVNKGSEFRVRLPVAHVAQLTPPAPGNAAPLGKALGCRILVADDNRDAAESMSMMLRLMGNEVRTVNDGLQAVAEAAIFRPDVILLDIGMPNLNGYDAARSIRKQRWGSEPLLVALTGWGQAEDRERAFEAGFDQHFTKPVEPDALEHLLASRRLPSR